MVASNRAFIATQGYLSLFPRSAWICHLCQKPYEDGVDIIGLNACRRHTFHTDHLKSNRNPCLCGEESYICDKWEEQEEEVMNQPDIDAFPLIDVNGTGLEADPFHFPRVKKPVQTGYTEVEKLPYLPVEIQDQICANLDPLTLVNAVRGGALVMQEQIDRARHAYAWSAVLKSNDFTIAADLTRQHGNIFLLGYGLRALYDSFEEPGAAPPQIHLLMTWDPDDQIRLNPWRPCYNGYIPFSDLEYPDILLTARGIDSWNRIFVNDLGNYIRNDSGKLQTDILYFHDEQWRLRVLDVIFVQYHDEATGYKQYKYALQLDKRRSWSSWLSDTQTLYLEQIDSFSTPDKPRDPWHTSG